jgi:hypothetical protein
VCGNSTYNLLSNQPAGLRQIFCCFKSYCSKEATSDSNPPRHTPIAIPTSKQYFESVTVHTGLIVKKGFSPTSTESITSTMAPGIIAPVPGNITSPFYSKLPGNSRQVSGMSSKFDNDNHSNSGMSRSMMPRKFHSAVSAKLSSVVQGLRHQSGAELGVNASSTLFNTNHATILEWIATERMSHLPPEGSSYDKVLAWAQLFVERLHSFDEAIGNFEGNSWLAAQLSYGYCAMLLEVCTDILSHMVLEY